MSKKKKDAKALELDDVTLDPDSDSEQPEAWQDRTPTDSEVTDRYEADRPPHHGS